ncbi:conserved hypothetical protein (plasmid) [Methylobacterium nodulans ORS 2060]|uniref:YaiI/YqxD family protein n=1 Tax=Methylobacterium nodulans (strain LMG 21967 / CNCM I-2342 / ORS 2060) TaxID=460265 RepID=B8IWT8_METNO|nr:conserved hypothetical protein [Methylobacterium nodulans ORS 2060]
MSQPDQIAIFVDADACSVKDKVYRVAARYGLHVFMVANSFMNLPREPWIERVVVQQRSSATHRRHGRRPPRSGRWWWSIP